MIKNHWLQKILQLIKLFAVLLLCYMLLLFATLLQVSRDMKIYSASA